MSQCDSEAKGHDEQFNLTDLFLRAFLYQW